jgi:hypothetical protein
VVNFPDDIRKHQESRDESSKPDPTRKKQSPLFCHHEADDKSETEKEDADLILESQSQDKSKPNPESGFAAVNDADHEVQCGQPEQNIKSVHREDVIQCQVNGGNESTTLGKQLPEDARAHPAGEKPGEKNAEETAKSRQQPDGQHRVPEEHALDVQQEKRKGRLVNISPIQVIAAGKIVEFVTAEAVSVDREYVNKKF